MVMVVVGKHMLGTLVDDNDGKTEVLREKVGPLPLGPPQMSHVEWPVIDPRSPS